MLRGLYTAATGLLANQKRNDVLANNLANVDTIGYKKEETVAKSFREALIDKINYEMVSSPGTPVGSLGKGVLIDEIRTDLTPGDIINTDNPLDIALVGSGYLMVRDAERGMDFYTRGGNLMLNPQGQLTTQSGYLVLGSNGPIEIKETTPEFTSGGEIFTDGNLIGQLQIVDLENVRKHGHNLFTGVNPRASQTQVQQGFLETSNVNAIDEMVQIISVMRAYETNQKVIQAYDHSLEKANEIGRV